MENKTSSIIAYILCIVFGVIICANPAGILSLICRIVGIVIIVCGVYNLVLGAKNQNAAGRNLQFIVGIVLAIIGIWILIAPGTFLKLIPIVIGIVLIYHGVKNIYVCFAGRKGFNVKWIVSLAAAVVAVILGLVLIFRAFKALEVGMVLLGIVLIYDGIAGLWTTFTSKKKENAEVVD